MEICNKKCLDQRGFELDIHVHCPVATVYDWDRYAEWRDHPDRPAAVEKDGNVRYNVKPYEPSTQGGRKGRRR